MLDAGKPIFEFLYAFLRENFALEEIESSELVFYSSSPTKEANEKAEKAQAESDLCIEPEHGKRPFSKDRIFDRFTRGPSLSTPEFERAHGWLEFGQVTDIVPDRSPDGYSYVLSYSMPIFVKIGQYSGVRETYRKVDKLNLGNRGLGDIITEVIQKTWDQLHVGVLSYGNYKIVMGEIEDSEADPSGRLPLSENNWWVKEWTCNVNGEVVDTTSEWRDVIHNAPDLGMKVIVFKFTVFEQVALIC